MNYNLPLVDEVLTIEASKEGSIDSKEVRRGSGDDDISVYGGNGGSKRNRRYFWSLPQL